MLPAFLPSQLLLLSFVSVCMYGSAVVIAQPKDMPANRLCCQRDTRTF